MMNKCNYYEIPKSKYEGATVTMPLDLYEKMKRNEKTISDLYGSLFQKYERLEKAFERACANLESLQSWCIYNDDYVNVNSSDSMNQQQWKEYLLKVNDDESN